MKNFLNNCNNSIRACGLSPVSILIGLVVIIIFPFIQNTPFQRNLGILILMWACLGSAWNIMGGYTGQVILGIAMFFGMGAYGTVLPYYYFDITPWIGILIGIVLSIILALLVAIPIFKLSAQYFSIATLALGETIRIIAINLKITNGMQGIDFLNLKGNFWHTLQTASKLPYYYMFAILLFGVFVLMLWINNSRMGYYFRTIKANPTSAESIGINVRLYKTYALLMSACIASICGSIYVVYQAYVDPSTVLLGALSTKMIIVCVIGGLGTVTGPLLGSIILIPLSEYIRAVNSGRLPGIDLVIYGLLIILVIIYQPDGILSILSKIINFFKNKVKRGMQRENSRNY